MVIQAVPAEVAMVVAALPDIRTVNQPDMVRQDKVLQQRTHPETIHPVIIHQVDSHLPVVPPDVVLTAATHQKGADRLKILQAEKTPVSPEAVLRVK
jgi:hypothetical protein